MAATATAVQAHECQDALPPDPTMGAAMQGATSFVIASAASSATGKVSHQLYNVEEENTTSEILPFKQHAAHVLQNTTIANTSAHNFCCRRQHGGTNRIQTVSTHDLLTRRWIQHIRRRDCQCACVEMCICVASCWFLVRVTRKLSTVVTQITSLLLPKVRSTLVLRVA